MSTRKAKWVAVLFLSTTLFSCSQQEDIRTNSADGEEIVTTISVKVPEVLNTRAVPDVYETEESTEAYLGTSDFPSVMNVDLNDHPLAFTVGIYIDNKEGIPVKVEQLWDKVADENAYFEFRLLKGQKYRIVAYADFNGEEKGNLEAISYTTTLNNELSDAFFASTEFVAKENVEVVLKRPFGKLRLIARDFNTFAAGEAFKIKKVKVAYQRQPMLATNTFNALTGEFNYDANAEGNHTVEAKPVVYTSEYNANGSADYATVFTMYLPANFGSGDTSGQYTPTHGNSPVPQSWFYPFDVTVEYEDATDATVTGTIERSYTIDIPVKRNWLTTVDAATFWTDNVGAMVTVDAAFDGESKVELGEPETVNSATELQTAIAKICKEAPAGETTVAKFVLGQDINVGDLSGGGLMLDTYPNDMEKTVEIYLDLNNHTIYSNKINPKPITSALGLVSIYSRNTILHIDDTSKEAKGGIKYTGTDPDAGYPMISCVYGGQVVINRGYFVSSTTNPVVYVYESEAQRADAQIKVLKALGWTPGNCPEEKPDFTDEQKKTIETVLEKLTATATINGGWFENAIDSSTPDKERCVINTYNVKQGDENNYWGKYHNYAVKQGYPAWTDWGEYKNQTFSFVHINGGSFVEQDPSKGDNIVGNVPEMWIGEGHIEKSTVDGKTVYTVIPKDDPRYF